MIDHFIIGLIFVNHFDFFHNKPAYWVDQGAQQDEHQVEGVQQFDVRQLVTHAGTTSEAVLLVGDDDIVHPTEWTVFFIMHYQPYPTSHSVGSFSTQEEYHLHQRPQPANGLDTYINKVREGDGQKYPLAGGQL